MTVSSVSLTLSRYQADVQSPSNQPVQDYKALPSALQSGDLAGAQTAFAALQKDLQPSSQTTQAGSSASQGTRMSRGGKDLESLANALSSGGSALVKGSDCRTALDQASFQGSRYGRVKSLLASGSSRITSCVTSHLILRPTSIEINPRWPGMAE
jgi:hypothetical protein